MSDKTNAEFIADCEDMLNGGPAHSSWDFLLEQAIERLRNEEICCENWSQVHKLAQEHITELKHLLRFCFDGLCEVEPVGSSSKYRVAWDCLDGPEKKRIEEILNEKGGE